MVKKCVMVFVMLIAMATVVNATDYTGTVSNIHMGSKTPADVTGITFSVNDNILTGDITIDFPFPMPPHHIDLTADLADKSCPNAYGTVSVYGEETAFEGCVTLVSISSTNLCFHFEGETTTGVLVSFDFCGTSIK
jgi:hypothetical protein